MATRIDRLKFIEFLKTETRLQFSTQEAVCGKNIYFLNRAKDDGLPEYQIEFISATARQCYTIYVKGITRSADYWHDDICNYVRDLNMKKDILVSTENFATLV